ncbi:hypothetical protein N7524_011738 [Penicillium chrysogenum]|nr:hypothetical protein N7524_011738 [Penicillium chrysogenum]
MKFHPFLDRSVLNSKVDMFVQSYRHLRTSLNLATNHVRSARDGPPSTKQRRSNQSLGRHSRIQRPSATHDGHAWNEILKVA